MGPLVIIDTINKRAGSLIKFGTIVSAIVLVVTLVVYWATRVWGGLPQGERDVTAKILVGILVALVLGTWALAAHLREIAIKKERKRVSDGELAELPGALLRVESHIDSDMGHRLMVYRGAASVDSRASISVGLRVSSYGRRRVSVYGIKNVTVAVNGAVLYTAGASPVDGTDSGGDVEPGAHLLHFHTIRASGLMGPPINSDRPNHVTVSGTILVTGDWGTDIREAQFGDSEEKPIRIPVVVDYATEIRTAIDLIRSGLNERRIELMKAELSYRGAYEWELFLPGIRLRIPIVGEWSSASYSKEAIAEVVERVTDETRKRLSDWPEPRQLRIKEDIDMAAEQEAEAEPEEDAGHSNKTRQ